MIAASASARSAVGLRGGVHALGEAVEPAAVVERDADQLGDDVRRQLAGDVGDEVAGAGRRHRVDDAARQPADALVQARHGARA